MTMDPSLQNPTFNFPFQPYEIQEKFMKELYFTIENSKLGIFESPTGTGKSLSMCCGALQWLKDYNWRKLEAMEAEIANLKEEISIKPATDDWLQEEYEKMKKNQTLQTLLNKVDKIKKQQETLTEMKNRVIKQKSSSNKTLEFYKSKNKKELENEDLGENKTEIEGDKDLILEEIEDRKECDSDEDAPDENTEDERIKIFISSRTHSQLSQFIGEIKRTIFKDDTSVVTLASRQHYCINTEVNRLKNVHLINERCLDMQKSKTKSTSIGEEGKVLKRTKTKGCSACPYYNQTNITKLKERMLVELLDMEDLIKCGKELKACPYYASRMAMDDAEVVLVSHAGVVSAGARSGVSLKLNNNILILDEAHGLTAALESAHSATVTSRQLCAVKTCLQFYVSKYRARLSSKSLLALNQITFVLGKLLGMIKAKPDQKQDATTIYTSEDFVIKAEIDHMNLKPLIDFCRNTRLAPKLHGFSIRYTQQQLQEEMKSTVVKKNNFQSFLSSISKNKTEVETKTEVKENVQVPTETSAGSGLYAILEFLERLCERGEDGRVLAQGDVHLKYLLLNPNEHFASVVSQCRSVIVAGGTMEPITEFKSLLTGDCAGDVNVLRCEHVVPPGNMLGACLSRGPSNVTLNFSYENRHSKELLSEIGRILRNICSIVPGGVVCFLPSYSYEQTVYEHMKNNKVIDAISKKKTVFREPKSASDVENVLNQFAQAVRKKGDQNGALLLSVVGGKLSEGLNFSDDLGRCVLVIGMPYPNVKSPELQEKMSYLNKNGGGGSVYYENLCMKAVNQCIGRAVRHINDYACVLLVDERYSRPQTTSALPSFVQNTITPVTNVPVDMKIKIIIPKLSRHRKLEFTCRQVTSKLGHLSELEFEFLLKETIVTKPKSLMTNCNFGPTIGSLAKFFGRHKNKK